jgi:hypothetical protein
MHLEIPLADIKSLALINETIIEPASQNVVSVVLDIAFCLKLGLTASYAEIG